MAADQAGNQDGRLVNSAVWAAGVKGQGIQFNGVNSAVEIGSAQENGAAIPWSVSMWVKRIGAADSSALMSSPLSALKLEQWPNTGKMGITRYGNADYTFNYAAPLNQWVHLVFINTGAQVKLYADCAQVHQINTALPLPLTRIGSLGSGEGIKGIMDEVRVYNYAISEAEIARLCQAPKPTSTPAIVATAALTTSTPTPTATLTPTPQFVSSSMTRRLYLPNLSR